MSAQRRASRPLPATRQEADELFRPRSPDTAVLPPRLARLNAMGLLTIREVPGKQISQAQAHRAILDGLYDEAGQLRVDGDAPVVLAGSPSP